MKLPSLVILDRDGVINYDSDNYIKSADEWRPIPGSLEAIAKLSQAGIKTAIATNQRGVSRGLYTLKELTKMHDKMISLLTPLGGKIDHIAFCTASDDSHPDRKPNPGMLLSIFQALNINPLVQKTYFVGDKLSDIQAAYNAKSTPILVTTGDGEETLQEIKKATFYKDVLYFKNLNDFVLTLLCEK